MAEHRIVINGTPVDFTCENWRFKTNLAKGHSHGASPAPGSVFAQPLVSHQGYTLWLEHVIEKNSGAECFWLMWYEAGGSPTIPASSVLDASEIKEMTSRLASFIQVP